jgi:dihydrofolate synthase/folylpolyglutamate synthase
MPQSAQTLEQWLDYIESLHPSHIELGLERVSKVAERLSVTRFQAPVITVTGTNGKGSAIAAMEAIGRFNGLKTAAYTSPHLLKFNERLRIDGVELNDDKWSDAFKLVDSTRGDIALTYFEFTTLAALVLIKAANVDLILLEVGLGGRLDAVNVVDNQCAIITSIDYDHQEWLGDTLEQIAFEKAGIARAHTPVIVANKSLAELVKSHIPNSSRLYIALQEVEHLRAWNPTVVERYKKTLYPDSLACGLVALALLNINCEPLEAALGNAHLPGRWQQLSGLQNWWFDVAHNPQAIANLAQKMKQEASIKHWIAVCGMLKDKRAIEAMRHLEPVVDQWLLVPTDGPRGQSAEQLEEKLQQLNLTNIKCFAQVADAVERGLPEQSRETGVIVFGSFIVVANVIEYLQQRN